MMEITKARNSAALEKAMGTAVIEKEPRTNIKENKGGQVSLHNSGPAAAPGRAMTTDDVNVYLRRVSTTSADEIDALVGDLQLLREKLLADGNRIEQDIVDFVGLGTSVVKLTGIISESVERIKASGTSNRDATSVVPNSSAS